MNRELKIFFIKHRIIIENTIIKNYINYVFEVLIKGNKFSFIPILKSEFKNKLLNYKTEYELAIEIEKIAIKFNEKTTAIFKIWNGSESYM